MGITPSKIDILTVYPDQILAPAPRSPSSRVHQFWQGYSTFISFVNTFFFVMKKSISFLTYNFVLLSIVGGPQGKRGLYVRPTGVSRPLRLYNIVN